MPDLAPTDAAGVRWDVTSWPAEKAEPGGDEEKLWLSGPDNRLYLWKPVIRRDGRRQGEDWAERLVHVTAESVGVPTARVFLARRQSLEGSISLDVKPPSSEAHTGSVLLSEIVPDYDRRARGRIGHNLDTARRVLTDVGPPPNGGCDDLSGFDVFCGYLVLDALVAGQDRHSDNWSVAVAPDGTRCLMHSYDHASSLGFNLLDTKRAALFTGERLDAWVARGCATRFEGGRNVTLVEWASRALGMASTAAAERWRTAVVRVELAPVVKEAGLVADMSQAARSLATGILEHNRRRLIDEL